MGLFDLICPPRVAPDGRGDSRIAPTEDTCQNCHSETPEWTECPAFESWPPELSAPVADLRDHPDTLRWWIDQNRLRTTLRRRAREEVFPFELGAHTLHIEVDPNERQIDSFFITGNTRFTMNLRGEGMGLFLNSDPLLAARSIRWLGGLRIFFSPESNSLTSDSCLLNWFVNPHTSVLNAIPVAYDPETGRTYGYTEYTRLALIANQCGSPSRISRDTSPMDGGIPLPLSADAQSWDGGPILDLPPEILEEMRRGAPGLGTGYADAGCGMFESLPVRFPYLFEFAHLWATQRDEAPRVDLLRLYRDIQGLQRLSERHPTPSEGPGFLSFLDRARLIWSLQPRLLAFENFFLEFDSPTQRSPLSITAVLRASGLDSIEVDHTITLSQLFIPGGIHLGETSFHLRGTGPHLNVRVTQVDSEILPFDVGQGDPSQRGAFHIRGGRIRDGEAIMDGLLQIPPGLRLAGDPERSLDLSINLNLALTVEIGEASYDLSAQLVVSTHLVPSDNGFEPEVGQSAVSLRQLSISPHAVSSDTHTPAPLVDRASLTFSDMPTAEDRRTGFHMVLDSPEGSLPYFRGIHAETFIPVRAYDPDNLEYLHQHPNFLYFSTGILYRPDLSFEDFRSALTFDLRGRTGVSDLSGELLFSTARSEAGLRTYEALLNAGPLGLPLSPGISLYLAPLHARFQATQETEENGACHFEVPVFEASANAGDGRRRGIVRGPIDIFQSNRGERTLTAHYDPETRHLDMENLDVRFSGRRIVIPALVNASREAPGSPPQITGGDIDGRFRGRWSLDTETGRGHGRMCLVGDSADISLRGAEGRVLADPLVSDTRWCATSVRRVDSAHHIVWGNFFLDTTFDWGLLRYFGIHVNMRERGRMAHDNFPYWLDGYPHIERLFFRRVFHERPPRSSERREGP